MYQQALLSTFAALLISASLVGTVEAYPITARSATTTVTGTYRPLDFNLTTLVDGTDALNFDGTTLTFTATLTGTFTTSAGAGYSASGTAGNWLLELSNSFDTVNTSASLSSGVITLNSAGAGILVGRLDYLGGLVVSSGSLLAGDTPSAGFDVFQLITTGGGAVLDVLVNTTGTSFDLVQLQDLQHIGPLTDYPGGLDTDRTNPECLPAGPTAAAVPCGSFTGLTASSVPEPASLMLLGIGFVAFGLSRRSRA